MGIGTIPTKQAGDRVQPARIVQKTVISGLFGAQIGDVGPGFQIAAMVIVKIPPIFVHAAGSDRMFPVAFE